MNSNQKLSYISDLLTRYEKLIFNLQKVKEVVQTNDNLFNKKIAKIEDEINNLKNKEELQEVADELYQIHCYLGEQIAQVKENKNVGTIDEMLGTINAIKEDFTELFTYKVVMPKYLDEFSCIGGDCPDTCCKGWKINIDKITYNQYKNFENKKLKKVVVKKIKLMPSKNRNFDSHSYIELDEDKNCPFLTAERLCRIQLEKDCSYLSDTCATYPRMINLVNDNLELSASMSCPEVRRLALFKKNSIKFKTKEDFFFKHNINNGLNLSVLAKDNPKKYLQQMRSFTIGLLQNSDYTISQRLILLGMTCNKLNNFVAKKRAYKIPEILTTYQKLLTQEVSQDLFAEFETLDTTKIKISILDRLIDLKFKSGIDKSYYMVFEDALKSFAENKATTIDNYEKYYRNYYYQFIKENQHILENYLVNYVFKELFPVGNNKTIFEEYMMLIINYVLIKILLVGYSGYHKKLNQKLIDQLIGAFSRTIKHDQKYLKKVYKFIKDNNYDTLAHIVALIKD